MLKLSGCFFVSCFFSFLAFFSCKPVLGMNQSLIMKRPRKKTLICNLRACLYCRLNLVCTQLMKMMWLEEESLLIHSWSAMQLDRLSEHLIDWQVQQYEYVLKQLIVVRLNLCMVADTEYTFPVYAFVGTIWSCQSNGQI